MGFFSPKRYFNFYCRRITRLVSQELASKISCLSFLTDPGVMSPKWIQKKKINPFGKVLKLKPRSKCCDHYLQQHEYRKHPARVLQTDTSAGIPSARGAVSACAHQQAWECSSCVCTPVADTHRVLPECRAAKNVLLLQTYFGRTVVSTFWDSSQFTFSRQRAAPFPINHTSVVTPGKTWKCYQTSRICFLLISHMLFQTQSLKRATTVSPPIPASADSSPCPQGTSRPLPSFHPIPSSSVISKKLKILTCKETRTHNKKW